MVLYDKTNPNLNAKADGPLNLSDEEQAEAIKTIENMRRSLDFFAQNGVDMITDFELPEHIESSGDTSTALWEQTDSSTIIKTPLAEVRLFWCPARMACPLDCSVAISARSLSRTIYPRQP